MRGLDLGTATNLVLMKSEQIGCCTITGPAYVFQLLVFRNVFAVRIHRIHSYIPTCYANLYQFKYTNEHL